MGTKDHKSSIVDEYSLFNDEPEMFQSAHVKPGASRSDFGIRDMALGIEDTQGVVLRGYVVKVYNLDSDPGISPTAVHGDEILPGLYCDVFILNRAPLVMVPVMSRMHGATDGEFWRPRSASVNIVDNALANLNSDGSVSATSIHKCDGDCVVVGFLDNNSKDPIILGQVPNPNSKIRPREETSSMSAYHSRVRGNKITVADSGEVTLDVTSQTSGTLKSELDGDYIASANQVLEILFSLIDDGSKSSLKLDNSGINTVLRSSNSFKVSGGGADTIHLGEESGLQKLMTHNAFNDIVNVLTEWLPVIQAASSMFGVPLPNSSSIITGRLTAPDLNTLLTQSLRGE